MQYPPYVSLANIVFSGKEAKQTLELAREFAKLLLASKTENMKMLGPAVAALARIAGNYRFQILVKSPSRKELHNTIAAAEELYAKRVEKKPDYSIDIDPDSII